MFTHVNQVKISWWIDMTDGILLLFSFFSFGWGMGEMTVFKNMRARTHTIRPISAPEQSCEMCICVSVWKCIVNPVLTCCFSGGVPYCPESRHCGGCRASRLWHHKEAPDSLWLHGGHCVYPLPVSATYTHMGKHCWYKQSVKETDSISPNQEVSQLWGNWGEKNITSTHT